VLLQPIVVDNSTIKTGVFMFVNSLRLLLYSSRFTPIVELVLTGTSIRFVACMRKMKSSRAPHNSYLATNNFPVNHNFSRHVPYFIHLLPFLAGSLKRAPLGAPCAARRVPRTRVANLSRACRASPLLLLPSLSLFGIQINLRL